MKYHSLGRKLLSIVCFSLLVSFPPAPSRQPLSASARHTLRKVPCPLGKLLHEDQRRRTPGWGAGRRIPAGTPLPSNCLWNCKPGWKRETVWRQRGGGAHSSSLSVSKPFAFQAQMLAEIWRLDCIYCETWACPCSALISSAAWRDRAVLRLPEEEPLQQAASATSLWCLHKGLQHGPEAPAPPRWAD